MILSSSRSELSPTKAKDTELYRQLPEASDLSFYPININ